MDGEWQGCDMLVCMYVRCACDWIIMIILRETCHTPHNMMTTDMCTCPSGPITPALPVLWYPPYQSYDTCPTSPMTPALLVIWHPPYQSYDTMGGGVLHQIFGTRVQHANFFGTQSDLSYCENEGSNRFKINEKEGHLDRKSRRKDLNSVKSYILVKNLTNFRS